MAWRSALVFLARCGLPLLLWAGLSAAAAAQDEYRELVARAVDASERGAYQEAHELFSRAHALSPNARTLRGLGVASFQLGHYAEAFRELEAALTHPDKPLDGPLVDKVRGLLERARAQVAVIEVTATPSDAQITLDGTRVDGPRLVLAPGPHVVRVAAPGFEAQDVALEAVAGGGERLPIALAPVAAPAVAQAEPPAREPPPSPRAAARRSVPSDAPATLRRTAWGVLGAAAATGASAGIVYWVGHRRVASIADECAGRPGGMCSDEEAQSQLARANYRTFERTTTALLVASGAAAVGAATLFTWQAARARRLTLGATTNAVLLHGTF